MELTALEIVGVHGDHADAVAVVTAQIGLHHMIGHEIRFIGVAAGMNAEFVCRFVSCSLV